MFYKQLLTLVALLSVIGYHAQIKGRVIEISEKGDSLGIPGAQITWYNSDIGVITNTEGYFILPLKTGNNQLIVKAVGYESKKSIQIDTSGFFVFVLSSSNQLNEIEVIHYSSGTEILSQKVLKTEVLGERSLMKAACCNLSESFETNPSIDVNFADAVSGTKQIQMLGLSGQYAQITKENMPYMRGLANNYGLSFIPGTWIQSIQLSKGAGSVVNGYESFTGQINTELQDPEKSDKLNFNAYVNENARNEYNLNLSRKFNPNFSSGILSHMSYNPLAQDLNGDGFADIPTGKQYNIMNKYSFKSPKRGFEAQFGGAYLWDERIGGQFKSIVPNYNDTMPLYEIQIKNKKWELYSKTGYIFKNRPATSMGLQLSYLQHDQNNLYGLRPYTGLEKTFYANYIFETYLGNTFNMIKMGASYLQDMVNETFDSSYYARNEKVPGAFAEYSYHWKDKFNMVAGLRADKHNYYGLFFTPRIHLRYAFTQNSILRFSAGRALRTASLFTDNAFLFASSRAFIIESSNPKLPYGLKPEIAWNYGLNFTQKFKINFREAYVTLDVYRTQFVDQVVNDLDQSPQEVNNYNLNGSSYSNTLQFEFNMEPRKRFFVKLAYRYVDTKVTFNQGLLQKAMVSKNRAFINLSYETKNKHWQFDFTTQYNGEKRLPGTQSNPAEYQRGNYSPEYFNLLGQITYMTKIYADDFNIYLGVENLLDYKQTNPIVSSDTPFGKYFDASMIWGPIYGRMLYAGLRFKIK